MLKATDQPEGSVADPDFVGRLRTRLEDSSLSAGSLSNLQKRLKVYDSAIATETQTALRGASKSLADDFELFMTGEMQVDDRALADRVLELSATRESYEEALFATKMDKIQDSFS